MPFSCIVHFWTLVGLEAVLVVGTILSRFKAKATKSVKGRKKLFQTVILDVQIEENVIVDMELIEEKILNVNMYGKVEDGPVTFGNLENHGH